LATNQITSTGVKIRAANTTNSSFFIEVLLLYSVASPCHDGLPEPLCLALPCLQNGAGSLSIFGDDSNVLTIRAGNTVVLSIDYTGSIFTNQNTSFAQYGDFVDATPMSHEPFL
jgi:hypothetical protein